MINKKEDKIYMDLERKYRDLRMQLVLHSKKPEGPAKDRVSKTLDNEINKTKKQMCLRLLEIKRINAEEEKNKHL